MDPNPVADQFIRSEHLWSQHLSKPVIRETVTGVSERMDQQWLQLLTILTGLEQKTLHPKDLSLGVDGKKGIAPLSKLIRLEWAQKHLKSAESAIQKNDTLSKQVDKYSQDLWEDSRRNPRYSRTHEVMPEGQRSAYYWRLFLHHGGLKDGEKIANNEVLKGVANVYTAMRLTGAPVYFKDNNSYQQVVYGRDGSDTTFQVLGTFNEFDSLQLAARLRSYDMDALSGRGQEERAQEIIERAFFLTPFPGGRYYEGNSFPVDPVISIRDRISTQVAGNKVEMVNKIQPLATAIKLGRMGATARAVFSVESNGNIQESAGLVHEGNIEDIVKQYARQGEGSFGFDSYAVSSEETNPGNFLRQEPEDVQSLIPSSKLVLFRNPQGEDLWGLVDWRSASDTQRFIFAFRPDTTKYPIIAQAADVLLRKV